MKEPKKIRSFVRGVLDFFFSADLRAPWQAGFNNQDFRKKIFAEIFERTAPEIIVETGTFRGATTEYMRRNTGRPVYSIEFHPRYFGFSSIRLLKFFNVHLSLGDSRNFLRTLSQRDWFRQKIVFFYLDAHWEENLPLREELEIIFGTPTKAVVMIDDFEVPGDEGYRFDDYGKGKRLDLNYLKTVSGGNFSKFFPSAGSVSETGSKRGSVILASDPEIVERLRSFKTLREAR